MKHYIKKVILLSLLCTILINLTGCWDNRDLTDISIISAVGIEKVNNKIELTLQIIKPSFIEARKQGSDQDAFWTFTTTGVTVFEAARNMLTTIDRKPYYGHTQLMIIGEKVAREGITDIVDFFERDHETRRQALVLIAQGISVKDILKAKSKLENIPSIHITDTIQNTIGLAKMKEIQFIDLIKELSFQGKNPVVGAIKTITRKEKEVQIKDLKAEGGAVFKKDKLVGWLGPMETRGYLFVNNEVKGGIINIHNPQNTDKNVAIEIKQESCKIDVKMNNEKPVILIDIKTQGNIGDQQGGGNLITKEMVKKMEEEIKGVIEQEVKNVIDLAQKKYKSDIFGFGEAVHRKYWSYWNKVKDSWDDEFEEIPVEIKVNAKLKRPGLIKNAVELK